MDLTGETCTKYDPRFRDWYAGTATGPKDVVIVLDDSGSMRTGRFNPDRWEVARDASKMVIDTLGRWDWVGIVLFDPVKKYTSQLVRATQSNRNAMKRWLQDNVKARGGTDFIGPLRAAFDILDASLQAGTTSKCTRAILFLTDGEAKFTTDNYNELKRRSEALYVALFTYAVGSGADIEKPKKMACQNHGIFYKVEDGADLGSIMSKFFLYFAKGVQSCTVRWTEYDDIISKKTLLAGCLPFYGPNNENPPSGRPFRGVSCMDINVVVDLDTVKADSNYEAFKCQTDQVSKQCAALYLRDCDLAQLRADSGPDSVCTAAHGGTPDSVCTVDDGYCVSPTCKDNLDYKDQADFACDGWVGDNCFKLADEFAEWGYTMKDQEEILRECPYSCLACDRETSLAPCETDCDLTPGNVPCRGPIDMSDGTEGEDSSTIAFLGGAYVFFLQN
jgi:hypothetical protein